MMGAFLSVVLLAVGLHHGEADPTLLGWIMTALSHILLGTLGFTELTVVIIIGIIILAMPLLIVVAYWANTRGGRSAPATVNEPPRVAEADE
jgi:asparagine N-glycosylation enzyme membrane subunit Stt3